MKNRKVKYLILIASILILSGCWESNKWTEKEKEEFRAQCSKKVNFDVNAISFTGFNFEEIDTTVIIEKSGSIIIDTLIIYPRKDSYDESRERYWASPQIQFNVNYKYEFYLGQDKPYILNNMEMVMWPQFSMTSEGYGCVMGNFTIDGEVFLNIANIGFTKRGFKYGWDK